MLFLSEIFWNGRQKLSQEGFFMKQLLPLNAQQKITLVCDDLEKSIILLLVQNIHYHPHSTI